MGVTFAISKVIIEKEKTSLGLAYLGNRFVLLLLSDNYKMANVLGGVRDCNESSENSLETESLARFAVDEHNKKENAVLEFGRVLKAKEQVVAGKLHHLTLEVIDAGEKKICEAKVCVKAWENSKELVEFTHTQE